MTATPHTLTPSMDAGQVVWALGCPADGLCSTGCVLEGWWDEEGVWLAAPDWTGPLHFVDGRVLVSVDWTINGEVPVLRPAAPDA